MKNSIRGEGPGYSELCEILGALDDKYEAVRLYYIGESLLSRPLPCIVTGSGRLCVYAGGFEGCGGATVRLLLAFAQDYAAAVTAGERIYNVDAGYLRERRAVCVIPMINPDGAELAVYGADETNPLRERLIAANGGEDFSRWRGNGRGVLLSRNLETGFARTPGCTGDEYPESEPETAALCNFLRMNGGASPVLTVSEGGSFVRYAPRTPRASGAARMLARLCGGTPEEGTEEEMCGLPLWSAAMWRRPSFDVGIGEGESCAAAYARLRELLFTAPVLC